MTDDTPGGHPRALARTRPGDWTDALAERLVYGRPSEREMDDTLGLAGEIGRTRWILQEAYDKGAAEARAGMERRLAEMAKLARREHGRVVREMSCNDAHPQHDVYHPDGHRLCEHSCDCGADEHNAKVDALLKAESSPHPCPCACHRRPNATPMSVHALSCCSWP